MSNESYVKKWAKQTIWIIDIDKEINKLMALIERTTTVNDITELRDGLKILLQL